MDEVTATLGVSSAGDDVNSTGAVKSPERHEKSERSISSLTTGKQVVDKALPSLKHQHTKLPQSLQ